MSELIRIENLSVAFPIHGGILGKKIGEVKAVNDISFSIQKGEIVGLVGESGCGKSTLGKSLIRLIEPSAGRIFFNSQEVRSLDSEALRKLRRQMQIIFQDPFSSLNPRMRVGQILAEPFIIHELCKKNEIETEVLKLLKIVGLRPESIRKFPHEFSGGQRQRIGIARALAVKPEFIVADEPVSALDVSIQAQILNLLKALRKDFSLTYLFISHDLNVIRHLCDRVIVMYLGKVMEVLTREQLQDPNYKLHPYTLALTSAAPRKHPDQPKLPNLLKDDVPSPANPPSGCVFHTRCPEAIDRCRMEVPLLQPQTACHLRGDQKKIVA